MTSNEKFERWWDSESRPGWRWGFESLAHAERLARAAWNARLSDEDAETCIDALGVASREARSHMANGKRSDRVWAIGAAKRYERTRRRLEGK